MFNNYFKVAWRNLWNNRIFSFINISGLSAGLACCILIFLFIQHELSYDKFHAQAENIYRVTSVMQSTNGESELAVVPAPWAPLMKKDFPEIKEFTRLIKDEKVVIGAPDQQHFYESRMLYADSTFFNLFTVSVKQGEMGKALARPNSIVLTVQAAQKYFDDTDPIGKVLEVTSFGRSYNAEVTAIVSDLPPSSHFRFDFLVSMETLGDLSDMWAFHMFQSYLLLNDNILPESLQEKFPAFVNKYITNNPKADGTNEIHLQRLTDIHLQSHLIGEIDTNGNIIYVYVFEGVALFILLTACFNFANLSTAKSLARAKEVGLRKVVGAQKNQLLAQFFAETILFALISLVIAVGLAYIMLPLFSQIAGKELVLDLRSNYPLLLMLTGLVCVVGLFGGLYPALALSAFRPIEVLRGQFSKSTRGTSFRKILVSLQFVISIVLIACTLIVGKQLDFLRTKHPGFNKENVIVLTLPTETDSARLESFKNELLNDHITISAGASSTLPSENIAVNQMNDGNSDLSAGIAMQMLFIDADFIPTAQMQLIAGRNFENKSPNDLAEGFIINEEAVKKFGWQTPNDAIGKSVQWVTPTEVRKKGKIIGVVENFNINPLRTAIQPLVMHHQPQRLRYLYLRVNQANATALIASIQEQFSQFFSQQSFEYVFLDDTLNNLYRSEQKLSSVFSSFSLLAILIACLGVFGLSFYSIQQRIKEIGIRKILGASAFLITSQLLKEFTKPVIIASAIATPLGWYLMNEWLKDFAYHIQISWTVFLIVSLTVLVLTLLTMIVQSIRAAMANPVDSLRTE